MERIKWVSNKLPRTDDRQLSIMSLENVDKARRFHESFPQYSVTPLANLKEMAQALGVRGVFVKDESYRFGLNAFKVLGGSFALYQFLRKRLGIRDRELTVSELKSDAVRRQLGVLDLVPGDGHRHGGARGGAGAEGRHQGLVAGVLGVVEAREALAVLGHRWRV